MQDEAPIGYHVIKWRNSEFHNHDTVRKRKMLGGVSFDGGAAAGSGRNERNMTRAGVQEAQPSFPNTYNESVSLSEIALSLGKSGGKTGAEAEKANESRDVGKAGETKDKISDNEKEQGGNHGSVAALSLWNNIIADVINTANAAINSPSDTSANNSRWKYSKYLQSVKATAYKFGKGIRTMLRKNEQDGGRRNGQQAKKKLISGTRAVTREDVYEIQVNSSYLLESYNKNGERSTLGK